MKHPVDVHVGKRVRHRRWMIGMTQQQLAEAEVEHEKLVAEEEKEEAANKEKMDALREEKAEEDKKDAARKHHD